jgi:hypothetical protein
VRYERDATFGGTIHAPVSAGIMSARLSCRLFCVIPTLVMRVWPTSSHRSAAELRPRCHRRTIGIVKYVVAVCVVAVGLLFPTFCLATDLGPLTPGTITDTGGSDPWTNPNNAKTTNATYATWDEVVSNSDNLDATNYGFTVPAGATINGITVVVRGHVQDSAFDSSHFNTVQLIKGGTAQGSNLSASQSLGSSDQNFTFGSASNLWGLTLSASDVNGSTFGVRVNFNDIDNNAPPTSIDSIIITVTYTAAAGTTPVPDLPTWGMFILLPAGFYWLHRHGLFSFEAVRLR